MKKLLLFLVAFFAAFTMNAQVYFSEDFENTGLAAGDTLNMTGWLNDTIFGLDSTNGGTQVFWILGSYNGYFAKVSGYKMTGDTTESWLVTPEIILPSTTTYLGVDIAMGYAYAATVDDQLRILVTTDTTVADSNFNKVKWDTLAYSFTDPNAVGNYGSFIHYSFDLSKYENDTIRIAFVYNGDNGNYSTTFEIDNIMVSSLKATDAFSVDNNNVNVEFTTPITDKNLLSSMFILDHQVADTLFVDTANAPDRAIVHFATAATIDNALDTLLFANPQTGKYDTLIFYAGVLPLKFANSASGEAIQTGYKATFVGVVAYPYSSGALVMDGYGKLHGMLVYDNTASNWTKGDSVVFTAYYAPYYDQQEVKTVDAYSIITSTANLNPDSALVVDPAIFDIDSTSANLVPMSYQNVLVHVDNITIYDEDTYGNYYGVSQNGDTLMFRYTYYNDASVSWSSAFTTNSTYNITGFVAYDHGHFKICPRNSGDISEVVATKVNNLETAGLTVYPNPATNVVNITGADIKDIQLFNTVGQLIHKYNISSSKAQINVSDLPQGIYLLRINTEKGTRTVRFIKK